AAQRPGHESFGIIGSGRHNDAQSRDVSEDGMIAARVMRRCRVTDADAATKQDGHPQPTAAHVLNFGELIDNLAESIIDEIDEHEIDDGPTSSHRGAAA